MRRFFYWERGRNYLLVGVPPSWLDEQPAGDVIIDPTIPVSANEDVWLEGSANKNGYNILLIGKAASYPKKRTILKFDISSISSSATVVNAQMKLYYYSAVRVGGTAWVDRSIQAHKLRKSWNEADADWDDRTDTQEWNAPGVGLDNVDADSTMESAVLFQQNETGSWKSWNLAAVPGMLFPGAAFKPVNASAKKTSSPKSSITTPAGSKSSTSPCSSAIPSIPSSFR